MKLYSPFTMPGLAALFASIAGFSGVSTLHRDAASSGTHVAASAAARRVTLVTAPEGNEARYRVREQLAGIDFPSDAVGVTSAVSGTLVIETNGTIVRNESRFVVDLTTLQTDNTRRDNYVRRNTLQTDSFPSAEFVPTAFQGLPAPLPTSGEITFQLTGDLKIHGVTKPITWDVTARASGSGYTGSAKTAFKFADFDMRIPRVRSVLSVEDDIRLEYDFTLVPEPEAN